MEVPDFSQIDVLFSCVYRGQKPNAMSLALASQINAVDLG